MQAYIVTVRPGSSDRYTDSIWLSRDHANDRVGDILEELQRRGKGTAKAEPTNEGWAAWVSVITIQDGYIAPAPKGGGK